MIFRFLRHPEINFETPGANKWFNVVVEALVLQETKKNGEEIAKKTLVRSDLESYDIVSMHCIPWRLSYRLVYNDIWVPK